MAVTTQSRAQNAQRYIYDTLLVQMSDYAGGATPSTGDNVTALVTDVEITATADTIEARAASDVWAYPIPRQKQWSASFSLMQQADVLATAFLSKVSSTEGPAVCYFSFTPSGGTLGGRAAQTASPVFTGYAVVESVQLSSPMDGPQKIMVRLKGQGPLLQSNNA